MEEGVKRVHSILSDKSGKNDFPGLTITEIVRVSKMPRSAVRTALAKLEGAEKVRIREVGMAKLYYAA